MRLLPTAILLAGILTAAVGGVQAQPPAGSQLKPDENACALCHGEAQLWDGQQLRLFVSIKGMEEDVHWLVGVNCHDCHGGDPSTFDVPTAHATLTPDGSQAKPFRTPLATTRASCVICHKQQAVELRKSVHAHAGEPTEKGPRAALDCLECHGQRAHGMVGTRDPRSPVYLDHQVATCGGCHERDLKTYQQTVHGKGLFDSGLVVTAVCADCHGPHGTHYAADKRSTLHIMNVAATCGKCHRYVEERLRHSVHGKGEGPGAIVGEIGKRLGDPGEKWKRNPSCTDCHQGHRLLDPALGQFRAELKNRCGNCHPDLSNRYAMSTHGELTDLGYAPAAKCSDCHDSHDMLAIDDPKSRLAPGANRLNTCRQCHEHAVMNFTQYDPHANPKDAARYPLLHSAFVLLTDLFYAIFVFFLIHAFLWFVRSFTEALRKGRHRTLVAGEYALVRYRVPDRIIYAMLLVAFLGLMVTGLVLKYGDQHWALLISHSLGGFPTISVIHHFFATVAIVGCAIHLFWALRKMLQLRQGNGPWRTLIFGPDSPVPSRRDLSDLYHMIRWFFGLGPKPGFERWTYWEKFDYWAVYVAGGVIGLSGLMLWYPNVFCRVLPGQVINLAKVAHAHIAVLAASFLFVIHFFHMHFRPEKFPMDLSAVTGLVSEQHLRKHRPEYVARLEANGRLDVMRRTAPSTRRLGLAFVGGTVVFSLGICLLGIAVIASLGH